MSISKRDILQMLREENKLLKLRNQQISDRLSRQQQAFRVLRKIDKLVLQLTEVTELDLLIHRILALALHACDSDDGSLLLLDDEANELVFAEVIGQSAKQLKYQKIAKDTGIVGKSIAEKKAVLIEDVTLSKEWSSSIDETVGFETKSLMCAPLFNNDDVIIGAIEVVNKKGDAPFDAADLNILSVTARFVSLILIKIERLSAKV